MDDTANVVDSRSSTAATGDGPSRYGTKFGRQRMGDMNNNSEGRVIALELSGTL